MAPLCAAQPPHLTVNRAELYTSCLGFVAFQLRCRVCRCVCSRPATRVLFVNCVGLVKPPSHLFATSRVCGPQKGGNHRFRTPFQTFETSITTTLFLPLSPAISSSFVCLNREQHPQRAVRLYTLYSSPNPSLRNLVRLAVANHHPLATPPSRPSRANPGAGLHRVPL